MILSNPPFVTRGPVMAKRPVLIAVPHAGRTYPAALLHNARVPLSILQLLEDRFVDRVADGAVAAGFTVIEARVARAYIDLNRAEDELDPLALAAGGGTAVTAALRPSARARAGLGLVPHRLARHGPLWRAPLTVRDLKDRIAQVHRPYHQAVAAQLAQMRATWGRAILIDLHSMPTQANTGPQCVIGDRYGATARTALSLALVGLAEAGGLRSARNTPYAGAHGLLRHARPDEGVEAVQLELDRALYLDAATRPTAAGVARMGQLLAGMATAAEALILGTGAGDLALAAE
jgi:N-formylglutamate amidohydrolase